MFIKLFNLLKSKKLAYFSIISITVFSLIGALMPIVLKKAYDYSFFSSPILSLLMILFFVNTLMCTIDQGKKAYKFPKLVTNLKDPRRMKYQSLITKEQFNINFLSNKLKQKGYKVLKFNNRIFAHKGKIGLWGAFLFHVSFLFIIIAVIISIETSFEGNLIINEGEEITEGKDTYSDLKVTPYFNNSFHGYTLRLNKFSAEYPPDAFPTNLSSEITLINSEKNIKQIVIKSFPPKIIGPYSFKVGRFGYSPHLIIYKGVDVVVDAYATLQTIWTETNEKYYDKLDLSPLVIDIEFLPDGRYVKGDRKNYKPIDPAYKLTIREQSEILYSGILPQNQRLKVKDYTIIMPEYIEWSEIKVVKDYGVNVLYFGFLLGTIGICIFYFINYQFIVLTDTSEETNIPSYRIGAGLKRSNPLFEEEFLLLLEYLKKS